MPFSFYDNDSGAVSLYAAQFSILGDMGGAYPVEDTTVPEDWEQHGDCREPAESVVICPNPTMQWVAE